MSGYKRIFTIPVGKTKEDAMKSLQELIMQYRFMGNNWYGRFRYKKSYGYIQMYNALS